MPLRLRVTSENRDLFGNDQVMEFAGCGGTLGRALDNDWVFPDPHRYVSGRHALVDFQDGAYYLVDTSRNGVYINDADSPVGRGRPQRLYGGDVLRIGDYEIAVEIAPEKKLASGKKVKADDTGNKDDSGPRDRISDSVIRAQLVAEDESMEMALVDEERLIGNASFDALLADGSAPHTHLSEKVPSLREMEKSGDRDAVRQADLKAVNLLLKSAGLKPADLAGVDPEAVLQAAGRVMRQMVDGLAGLLQERAELKTTFRLAETTVLAGNDNPLKFSSGSDAIKYLLGSSNDDYLPPAEAVRESFQAVTDHEQAIPRAMVQAFREFMDHFAPGELRQQFDHYLKQNRLRGLTNKRKYWDLYEEAFSELTSADNGALPDAFSQEFARAYQEEVNALKSSRNK